MASTKEAPGRSPAPPPPPPPPGPRPEHSPGPRPTPSLFTMLDKELFRSRERGRRNKHGPQTFLRKYGLLRNVVARTPLLLAMLETFVVHAGLLLVHCAVIAGTYVEAFVGMESNPAARAPHGSVDAALLLGAMAFDAVPGLVEWLLGLAQLLGTDWPSGEGMCSVRRGALLYTSGMAVIVNSAGLRWHGKGGEYMAPPLFGFLAYGVAPWIGFSSWLVMVQPGDHHAGTVVLDFLSCAVLLVLRLMLFGRRGFGRVPKAQRSLLDWAQDAVVLAVGLLAFDYAVLRSAWLEQRKNWKYVLCALNLAWPLFFFQELLEFYRALAVPKSRLRRARLSSSPPAPHEPSKLREAGLQDAKSKIRQYVRQMPSQSELPPGSQAATGPVRRRLAADPTGESVEATAQQGQQPPSRAPRLPVVAHPATGQSRPTARPASSRVAQAPGRR